MSKPSVEMPDAEPQFAVGDIHGIAVNLSSYPEALRQVEHLIKLGNGHFVCFFEANLFYQALKKPEVKEVINAASLIYPDGIAGAKVLGWSTGKTVERISGPTFILKACEYGVGRNWRHFFLGGEEGVAERLSQKLQSQYPGMQIAGCYCPPFRPLTEDEEREVKQMIEASKADLLWVGLGGPKQEFWMRAHLGNIKVPVMLGVGAAFDFHSDNRPWAPRWIRRWGLEWGYRMVSGGKNTMKRNIKCVSYISGVLALDFIKSKLRRKPGSIFPRPPASQTR